MVTTGQTEANAIAFAAINLSNELIDCWTYNGRHLVPASDIQKCRKARQQAGRLIAKSDPVLADLVDFIEDFGGDEGHNFLIKLMD